MARSLLETSLQTDGVAATIPGAEFRNWNTQMNPQYETIARWLAPSRRGVAFTGAGVSTESGIPDFRSPDGIWARTQPVGFDEFLRSADARYEYWRQKSESHRGFFDAEPNLAHQALARWESLGRLRGVVTQNIDGLHQLAGSRSVLELHGTAREIACLDCAARYAAEPLVEEFTTTQRVPECPKCGGMMKHATISFGQSLEVDILQESSRWSRDTDFFLVMGSSLVVQPAASLPGIAKRNGARLIIINREPTPLDALADVVVNADIGETVDGIQQALDDLQSHPGHDS